MLNRHQTDSYDEYPQDPDYEMITDQIPTRRQDAETTKWQLDPNEILCELENDLKGNYWSATGKKWVSGGKKIVNDEGVRSIISVVRTHINKVTFLSNLTEDEISVICRTLHRTLAKLIFYKQDEFEIQTDYLDAIMDKVMNLIYIGLKKCQNEGEREFLKRTERRIERINVPEKESGFLSIFKK